jgi:hypothetical protein
MLAHSPPLPLVIDYDGDITAEDEEGIALALELRDGVRRIRLAMPVPNLQKLIMTIDEEYPVLEYLLMAPLTGENSPALTLPGTLLAPHLRHLLLISLSIPMGILTTPVGIVTLSFHGPPIHLLSAKYSAPMDFIHTTAEGARDRLFISLSRQ